ncbi:MAG: hypothetical protein ACSLE6_09680 [Mycobacterium sp.]
MGVLLVLVLVGLVVYFGWRLARAYANRPQSRTIGPDDDPDFLWRLGNDQNKPR